MATSLRSYVSEAIQKVQGDLWREESIASLTTTTTVVTALAVGGWSAEKFTGQFMWRPDTTTTADKSRYITNYTASTGTLTHAGTNYADTTATGEKVIITKIEPYIVRKAVDDAIRKLRQRDRLVLPLRRNQRYPLGDFSWIRQPSDIMGLAYTNSPVISRNRYLQKRTPNSSAVWAPDDWTVTSNNDTTPYETYTGYKDLNFRYILERSGGTDASLQQVISAFQSGVSGDYPSGETITAAVYADPLTAGNVLVSIADGTTTNTDSGTGASPQWISDSLTLAEAAETITVTVTSQTQNEANRIYEILVCVGELTDAVKRDEFHEYGIPRECWDFDQYGALTINLDLPSRGQLIVYSKRPYPGFDTTRLASGAADADESDAPLMPVVAGAMANIYFGLEGQQSPNYEYWKNQFDLLHHKHLYGEPNLNHVVRRSLAPAARTYR